VKRKKLDIVQVSGKIPLKILNMPVEEAKDKKEAKKKTKKEK
jgi:hypothetical protein